MLNTNIVTTCTQSCQHVNDNRVLSIQYLVVAHSITFLKVLRIIDLGLEIQQFPYRSLHMQSLTIFNRCRIATSQITNCFNTYMVVYWSLLSELNCGICSVIKMLGTDHNLIQQQDIWKLCTRCSPLYFIH